MALLRRDGRRLGFPGRRTAAVRWARAAAAGRRSRSASEGCAGERGADRLAPSSADASRAVGDRRPVLIDFEADWCLPCREMDRTTFRDPAVVRESEGFAMLRADVTAQDDAASALMERYKVQGVPTYVLLGPDGQERRRLVGFIPADEMLDAMRAARDGRA